MGSVKRKSLEESSDCAPPQKLQREDDDDSTKTINEELVGCVHDVSFPENYLPPAQGDNNKPPAKEFPFALDSFQSEAIKCLDNGESVMVSAHTSAGKTVVASYAIAMSLRENQRVIYTSPTRFQAII